MLITHLARQPDAPRSLAQPDARLRTWLQRANQAAAQASAAGMTLTPAMARDSLATLTRTLGGSGPAVAAVLDGCIDGTPDTPLRLYDPEPGSTLPVCVYLHGGGHMAGSIEVYDPICRRIAVAAHCRVIAIEYRLAPEHPYPQGLEDCARALARLPDWLAAQGIALPDEGFTVAGDSGGGALTASLAAMAIDQPELRIARQVLIYPSLDYTLSQGSVLENGTGLLLEASRIRWYFDHYFQGGENRTAASPLFMPCQGLPPTLLITAGLCPLRDEGYVYADKLQAAGVACTHLNLPGMIHAFLNMHTLVPDACGAVYAAIAGCMRQS